MVFPYAIVIVIVIVIALFFGFVIVFYFVIVLLLFRFCFLITLTRCLIGHNLESLFEGVTVTEAEEAFCSGWLSKSVPVGKVSRWFCSSTVQVCSSRWKLGETGSSIPTAVCPSGVRSANRQTFTIIFKSIVSGFLFC